MLAAFDSLLMDNYHAYILTLELYTVAIYCLPNGRCKIQDVGRVIRTAFCRFLENTKTKRVIFYESYCRPQSNQTMRPQS